MSEQSGYNGYSSRETYDVSLWLNNDEGYYNDIREMADSCVENAGGEGDAIYSLRDAIENYWDDITDPDTYGDADYFIDNILPMVKDVGSLFRVNWDEIAKEFLSE